MEELSYYRILHQDTQEHESCRFKWDCEHCDSSLCIRLVGIANFPSHYGHFKVLAFTNNKDHKDHIMIVKGELAHQKRVLIRLHSSCLTGDVLGSLRCDCGTQLHTALSMIEQEGVGALLYMQQEGRGIGLSNKIKAYMLQESGVDTYDANVFLGFCPDERQYEIAAAMLQKLDISSIRLLTNNPAKIQGLTRFGVNIVERLGLEVPPNKHNKFYLLTKRERFHHLLSFDYDENNSEALK
jgi:3,4-dihydroxy 2-butanone 4-phosphate synthase/GTP cyclohydrolase II